MKSVSQRRIVLGLGASFLCVLILGCVSLFCGQRFATTKSDARIELLGEQRLRVSPTETDAECRVELRVTNAGGSPLRLGPPRTTCGCLSATVRRSTLGPGETTSVEVTARPPRVGKKEVQVRVPTNDPLSPTVQWTLEILGVNKPPFLVRERPSVEFGFVQPDALIEQRVFEVETIEAADAPDALRGFKSTVPGLEVVELPREQESPRDGVVLKRYRLGLRFRERPKVGLITGDIIIDGSGEFQPDPIKLSGTVLAMVRAVPERLEFMNVQNQDWDEQTVHILGHVPDVPLTLECAKNDPTVSVEAIGRSDDRVTYRVRLNRDSSARPPAPLTFRTNHPLQEEVIVPLVWSHPQLKDAK